MNQAEIFAFPKRPSPELEQSGSLHTAEVIYLPSNPDREFHEAFDEYIAELRYMQLIAPDLEYLESNQSEDATRLRDIIHQRYLQHALEQGIGPALDHTLNQIDLMKAHPATRQLLMPPRRQP